MLQGRVQTAADAATLAGARALDRGDAEAIAAARQVFTANMGALPAGAELTVFSATPRQTADGDRSMTVEARVRTRLALAALEGMFGETAFTTAELQGQARAAARTRGLELALVMDNTGSMHGAKIDDLRTAMRTMIGVLFRGAVSVPNLHVAVVPYSATVNIGRQHGTMLSSAWRGRDDLFRASRWKGCVMARSNALAETDAPPAAGGPFDAFFYESTAVCAGMTDPRQTYDQSYQNNCSYHPNPNIHWSAPNQWRSRNYTETRIYEAPMAQDREFGAEYWRVRGPNAGCPAAIQPLTSQRADIDAMIGDMHAWARGGTLTNWGLVWGWRALSPRWRGLWRYADGAPVPATLPRDYDAPAVNKAIVLMTDGDNMFGMDHTAFGREGERLSGSQLDPAMLRVCDAIKREGIVLYVVSFGSVSSDTRANLQRCASDPATETRMPGEKYFHAPTGDELEQAFRGIGGQLIDLRLVE
jgi:hypothetical protein